MFGVTLSLGVALILPLQAYAGCGTCDKTIVENAVASNFRDTGGGGESCGTR